MSKCPTRAGKHVRDRARAMLCLPSYSYTVTFAKGTGRRRQTQPGSKPIYSGENFSPSAHLLGIGPRPKSQGVTTLLNFWFVLLYFKTLTAVTLEICSLHFLDMLQHN